MFIYILEWWEDEIFVDAVLSDEVWHGGQAVDVNSSVEAGLEAGYSFRAQTQMWELFGTQCRWLSPTTQLLFQTDYRMWTIAAEWRLLVSRLCFQGRRKIMERDEGRRLQEEMKEAVKLIVVLVAHLGFDFVFLFSLNTNSWFSFWFGYLRCHFVSAGNTSESLASQSQLRALQPLWPSREVEIKSTMIWGTF